MIKLSHPYMTTRKTIALTRWTFVGKVMSLLFNTLFRFVLYIYTTESFGHTPETNTVNQLYLNKIKLMY